jgi:hypothetical protein
VIIARQSTARTVIVGPVLDADGVAVTGGVVADFKISKNGAAPAALNGSATLTHRHTGHYSLALTASDLDTVGQAEVVIDDTVNACAPKELTVIEEAIYDAYWVASATGLMPANVTQWLGSAAAAVTQSGVPEVDITHIGGVALSTSTAQLGVNVVNAAGTAWASGAITAASIASDAITAAKVAADVTTEFQSGLATAASIATEIADALAADTHGEPTGVPAATATLVAKVGYLYMALRNGLEVTASAKTFLDDSGAAEWEKALSDDGTTYAEDEASAP